MPNYSLVTPTQRVISFEDMVKPYQMLQAEIDKQDAAVAQLLSQVGDWEKLRDDPNSQKAYNSYKEYETKLRDLANDIADNGLRNNAKSRVLNLAAQYSGTINPIKEAWDRRNKLAEMTFKMGPSAILQFNPAERGLDEFMKNPMLTPKVLDRNAIAKQASDMYSTFTNDLLAVKQGPNIDRYNKTFYKKYGITSDQASDFVNLMKAGKVNEAMQKYPPMQSIFNQVYDDTGVASWGNPEADTAVRNSILNGAYSAIGKSDIQMYEDKEAVGALELRNRIRATRALAKEGKDKEKKSPSGSGLNYERRNILTDRDVNASSSEWNKYKNFFRKTASGSWELTPEGKRQKISTKLETYHGGKKYSTELLTDFGKFLKKYRLEDLYPHDVHGKKISAIGRYSNRTIDRLNNIAKGATDATLDVEYVGGIAADDYKNVVAALNRNANKGYIPILDVSKSNKGLTYSEKDNKLKVSDLEPNKIVSAAMVYGRKGNYLELKLKGDDTTYRVAFNRLSDRYRALTEGNWADIDNYEALRDQGYNYIDLGTGPVSITDAINQTLNNVGGNMLASLALNSIKDSETTRGEQINEALAQFLESEEE